MAAKAKQEVGPKDFLIVLSLLIFVIWAFAVFGFANGILVIFFVFVGFGVLGAMSLQKKMDAARTAMEETLPSLISEHAHTLERKLRTAVKINDYGRVVADSTNDVVKEFLESVAPPFDWKIIESDTISFTRKYLSEISQDSSRGGFDPGRLPTDGIEFEYWCAESFKLFDWETAVTKSGGDQGLDLIIKKNGVKIGIQTKLYDSPVGNKAVQEAHAGMVFYGLDKAAVLTNAGFTKSARELAAATNVILMSHFDIPKADNLLL